LDRLLDPGIVVTEAERTADLGIGEGRAAWRLPEILIIQLPESGELAKLRC
jgi:hypothetical protein